MSPTYITSIARRFIESLNSITSIARVSRLKSETLLAIYSLIRFTKIPCEIIKTTLILLVTGQEFCVDVSTYEPVVWAEVPAEQCDTAFVKQCEDREEEVCADVTETRCQVSPARNYTYLDYLKYLSLS